MSNKDERQTIDDMIEGLDFNALIKRRIGRELTDEEKAHCSDFDELYDALLPNMVQNVIEEGDADEG